jgi:hypothetical protein
MTFCFLDQLNLWKFSVWAAAMALYSSYLMIFFFFFWSAILYWQKFFSSWGPLEKKIPPKFEEPICSWPSPSTSQGFGEGGDAIFDRGSVSRIIFGVLSFFFDD